MHSVHSHFLTALQNVKLSALPKLAGPYGGLLAASYQTAVARSKSLSVTANAASVLQASVTNTAA